MSATTSKKAKASVKRSRWVMQTKQGKKPWFTSSLYTKDEAIRVLLYSTPIRPAKRHERST